MPARLPNTSPSLAEDDFRDSPLEHVRSLFVGFLQGLFNASPPGVYHWTDDETSEIFITNEGVIRAEEVGMRPAISITRGPVQFYSLGLDDMMGYDFRTGQKKKSVLVPGTSAINVCSRVPLESERLAWVCAEQLWLHRELLMRAGFFEIGRQPAIGSPTPAGSLVANDSSDEWFATSVTCPWQFYRTSQTTPINKRVVRNIENFLHTRLRRVPDGGPISSPGANPPWLIQGHRPPPFAPEASDANGNSPRPGERPPVVETVPHPLNPSQRVVVRAVRPNSPAVKPPAMGGRTIPLSRPRVEDSCSAQAANTSRFKV